jgi:D-alanyl-lipoteichoic acid acyltransferase DltB (MBOAT superfamily)
LLFASYVFYGWWDWRFLILIIVSSAMDFLIGRAIGRDNTAKSKKKTLLITSIILNLGILGVFKYYNFFIESFKDIIQIFGGAAHIFSNNIDIILPVGISFYTFQSISYIIDVYRNKINPEKHFLNFFAYVAFFPQLVAGPIERASNLLPQFSINRQFNFANAVDGCRQMLWGFFKKIVIADNLSIIVNSVYGNTDQSNGTLLFIATFFFAFQIYCDFSGYSDIAIGCARLFGFSLTQNFSYPYFSRSIPEFWRRWHMSLSNWFRDYLFIPLGGSKVRSKIHYLFNIMITFVVSGLWHGPNWTYVIWGGIHGLSYIPSMVKQRWATPSFEVKAKRFVIPNYKDIPSILFTFGIVLLAWIFFRSQSLTEAVLIVGKILKDLFMLNIDLSTLYPKRFLIIFILITIEWLQRDKIHPLMISGLPKWVRFIIYYFIIVAILFFGVFNYNSFIYFQF